LTTPSRKGKKQRGLLQLPGNKGECKSHTKKLLGRERTWTWTWSNALQGSFLTTTFYAEPLRNVEITVCPGPHSSLLIWWQNASWLMFYIESLTLLSDFFTPLFMCKVKVDYLLKCEIEGIPKTIKLKDWIHLNFLFKKMIWWSFF
jgi:hypothetical protein